MHSVEFNLNNLRTNTWCHNQKRIVLFIYRGQLYADRRAATLSPVHLDTQIYKFLNGMPDAQTKLAAIYPSLFKFLHFEAKLQDVQVITHIGCPCLTTARYYLVNAYS